MSAFEQRLDALGDPLEDRLRRRASPRSPGRPRRGPPSRRRGGGPPGRAGRSGSRRRRWRRSSTAAARRTRRSGPPASVLWTLIAPIALSPARIGTPRYDFAWSPDADVAERVPVASRFSRSGSRGDQDPRGQALAERERRLAVRRADLVEVRELDPVVSARRAARRSTMSAPNVCPHLLADELDQRVEVELAAKRLADLVDRRQLGEPLAGLVDQAGVLEGDAQARREGRQEPTSDSLNASSRSRFWSEITPRTSPPTMSGTNRPPTSAARPRSCPAPARARHLGHDVLD